MQINWQQASTPRRGSSSNCEMKQVRSQSKKENRDQSCSEPYDPCDRAHHEMASPPCYRPRAWDPPIVRGRPAALTRPVPDSRPARPDPTRPGGRAPHGTVLVRDPIPSHPSICPSDGSRTARSLGVLAPHGRMALLPLGRPCRERAITGHGLGCGGGGGRP
jgi:hypothetical protein